jgi:hypothetical protein
LYANRWQVFANCRFNGKQLRIVGVCDSSGGVYCAAGLDTCKLLDHKKSKNPISTYMQSDDLGEIVRFPNALEMAQSAPTYDALLEAVCAHHEHGTLSAQT